MNETAAEEPRTVALTPTQQRIWTSQRLAPGAPVCNMANRFHFSAGVDVGRLVAAFDRVVDHCDVLRMVMEPWSPGRAPSAVLVDRKATATEVISVVRREVDAWITQRVSIPIDATRSVYDSVVIEHPDDGTVTWWLDLHHVATDAWTSALIYEATATVYADGDDDGFDLSAVVDGGFFARGDQATASRSDTVLPARPVAEPASLYGVSRRADTRVRRLDLPLTAADRVGLESAIDTSYRSISPDLAYLAIAAMAVAQLVHRIDGRPTVRIDTPLHHRASRRHRRLVGPTMDVAELAVDIDPSETNQAMFARVVRSIMDLLREGTSGAESTGSSGLLVNVVTANYGDFAGLPTERQWVRAPHVESSQVLGCQVFPDGPNGGRRWEVETPEAGHIADRLPEHLAAIVADLVDRPDGLVGASSIITPLEAEALALLNPSPSPRQLDRPTHEQIAAALRASPEWIVVEHGDRQVTASEFDLAADRVARWLRARGVGVGTAVAIRLPRGVELLIAVHGVLRAGGVLVLLDPDGPGERHAVVLDEADAHMVIDALPTDAELESVDVGDELVSVGLDDRAYVIFTSGSTGRPKGVPITHRGLADYLRFATESFEIDQPTMALHSSVEFDLTITSLFTTFVTGGRLIVFDQGPLEALAAIARNDRVDTLKATPSQIAVYQRFAPPDRPLRTVVVGGEAFHRPVAAALLARCAPGVRIFNEYGPTEAVVGCMIHEFDPSIDTGSDVPIGRAAPGSELAVLDAAQQFAPVGAWGELYVRRPGMASAYLHRPDETTRRFVEPEALRGSGPGIWYRTGDRVRVERPGTLGYGGRVDDQLKVKGFRLEPAEVEAALVRHPKITRAIVRPWPSENTDAVLAAWYETTDQRDISVGELRRHARRHLAEHAVPSAFVRVDQMPLAASAKADPSVLPAPRSEHRSDLTEPPTGDIERQVAAVWARVLGIDGVGATDDFFEIGGASLSAIEVVADVEDRFGIHLDEASVFDARTVREIAALVEKVRAEGVRRDPIAPLEEGASVPLSSSEEAMLFDHRRAPASTHYNVARLYTLDELSDLDTSGLHDAFRSIVELHEPLHTSYAPGRPTLPADVALAWNEHPATTDADFAQLAQRARAVPFDLDAGPLVRIDLAQTGERRWALSICLHHISLGVGTLDLIWRQAVDVYSGRPAPELTVSYGAHAAWQRARTVDGDREQWLERSRRRPEPAVLRTPKPERGEPDGYLARYSPVAAVDLTVAGFTPFHSAFAAAAVALSHFTAASHVELGIAASTKDHVDAAPLVGHHLNSLPIGVDVDANVRFDELLERVSNEVGTALRIRTYPFASIVRDARAAGLVAPDLAFMLAYDTIDGAEFPDARVSHRILASEIAVTDVTFFVQERPDSLQLSIEYRGSVIDDATAARLLDLFETVLRSGARHPDATIQHLVSTEAPSELTGEPLDRGGVLVAGRIVDLIARDGRAESIVDASGQRLTRLDLAHRVDHVAAAVERLGAPPRVGVAVARGLDVVPALLGVQFAGAAAVPLDPTVGRRRLEAIIDASDIGLLVHDGSIPAATDGSVLGIPAERCVRVSGERRSSDSDVVDAIVDRVERLRDDDVAYVVFTSGSTGTPRGVAVSHANLAASTLARTPWYSAPPARFLLTSSIGFDSSVVGLYWPLCDGGVVVFPGDDDVHDIDRLAAVIAEREISHVLMVPSLYRALLDRRADRLGALDTVIVAGETCPSALVEDHRTRLPGVALVNEYGPTEATVWATAHRLDTCHGEVPIGGPIPGARLRVVGDSGASVPLGVAGELWIGGPTVTAGYIDAPEATQRRFTESDGHRWYRTGDRVRIVDGVAMFVGRVDDQLNVGGVRVEPEEIETHLRSVEGIRDAVVVAVGSPPSLVAHVVSDRDLDEDAIRSLLTDRVPTGAVPRRFLRQASLPLSANGKVDREAAARLELPERAAVPESSARGDVTVTQEAVLAAWSLALDRSDLGLDTDFFAIGGNSLAAVEIVTRLAEFAGGEVPIAELLGGRTPRGMADLLDGRLADISSAPAVTQSVTLRVGTVQGPLIVMVPAWDDVFGYQALADAMPDDVTVIALVHSGTAPVDNVDELVETMTPLAVAASVQRSSVTVVGWSVGGVVAIELAEALHDAGVDVDRLALVDTLFPGEGRHLWSNRWWKYKSMVAVGAVGEVCSELITMLGRRARRLRRALRRGKPSATDPTAVAVGASRSFPPESLTHEIRAITVPLTFYSATGTNPKRTVVHWQTIAPQIEIVSVDGRHRGVASIMRQPGVQVIADHLTGRIDHPAG